MSKLKLFGQKQSHLTPTQRMLSAVSARFAQQGTPFANSQRALRNYYAGMESLDDGDAAAIQSEADELETTLTEVITQEEADSQTTFTPAQKEAALQGAVAAASGPAHFQSTGTEPVVGSGVVQASGDGAEGDLGRLKSAVEAYDETENRNTIQLSFLYNLRAARQDDFGEAFFPTVTAASNENAVSVTMDLFSVLNDIKRNTSGDASYEWDRHNVVMALRNPKILHNDTTRCYPIVRSGINEKYFVDAAKVAPAAILLEDGTSVTTAPLKFGATIGDYIGLTATDELIAAGVFNRTDALDPHVQLSDIYVEIKGEVFRFSNLDMIAGADFNYVVQGKNRQLQLNLTLRGLNIDKNIKQANGSATTALQSIVTAEQQARLTVDVAGTIDLETGRLQMTVTDVTVTDIHDKDGNKLDVTKGVGKTAHDLFDDAKAIGYSIITRRINSNRRERGQMVELHQETRRYTIPTLAPITVIRPTGESENQDSARLDRLVTLTYIRCTNAAVDALLRSEQLIRSAGPVHSYEELYAQDTLGLARYLVTPWYQHRELDVNKEIQTLKSHERLTDLTAVLVNAIRHQVYTAYWESGYKAACDVIYGPGSKKPVVVIGTDANIINYLMVTGDFRTVGNEFDIKLVSTNNELMKGKIRWSFGRQEGTANDLSNPLHFGNMIWRPEVTAVLPVAGRDNTFSRELTVQPSFRHVTHLPIMGAIDVINLPQAVVDYNINTVKTV